MPATPPAGVTVFLRAHAARIPTPAQMPTPPALAMAASVRSVTKATTSAMASASLTEHAAPTPTPAPIHTPPAPRMAANALCATKVSPVISKWQHVADTAKLCSICTKPSRACAPAEHTFHCHITDLLSAWFKVNLQAISCATLCASLKTSAAPAPTRATATTTPALKTAVNVPAVTQVRC